MSNATKGDKHGPAFCFLLFSAAIMASADCARAQVPAASPPPQPVKMQVRVYDYVRVPSKLGLTLAVLRAQAAPSGDEESSPKITLRVYNYARVPAPILVSTERDARRIFRRTGLETEWLDCRLSATEPRTPACERPLSTSDLILKLLPPSMAQSIAVHDDTFGIALTVDGKPATDAIIFYQRVLDLARTGYIHEQEILAAAMAHEIGHLLLGSNSHSSTGIMRAKWNRDELELARLGRLLFTPEQSKLIRDDVAARAGQQTASGVSWPSEREAL